MKTLKQLREDSKKTEMPGLVKAKGHIPAGFIPKIKPPKPKAV